MAGLNPFVCFAPKPELESPSGSWYNRPFPSRCTVDETLSQGLNRGAPGIFCSGIARDKHHNYPERIGFYDNS